MLTLLDEDPLFTPLFFLRVEFFIPSVSVQATSYFPGAKVKPQGPKFNPRGQSSTPGAKVQPQGRARVGKELSYFENKLRDLMVRLL
jgi:hypothetical protein